MAVVLRCSATNAFGNAFSCYMRLVLFWNDVQAGWLVLSRIGEGGFNFQIGEMNLYLWWSHLDEHASSVRIRGCV